MATIKIDDVTGERTDVKAVKISFDGTSHTLDLAEPSRAAFAAFLADPTENRSALVNLLSPETSTRDGSARRASGTRSGSGSGSGSAHTEAEKEAAKAFMAKVGFKYAGKRIAQWAYDEDETAGREAAEKQAAEAAK